MSFLTTPRMSFRKFTFADFNHLLTLDTHPEVMKYISGGQPMTEQQVRATLSLIMERYQQWKNYGIWAAFLTESNQFMGWFALKPLPKIFDVEVGYRLLPEFWGKGLATEGTLALLNYGFKKLDLQKIVAIADPQNLASRRVLEKTGFKEKGFIANPFSKTEDQAKVIYYEFLKTDF